MKSERRYEERRRRLFLHWLKGNQDEKKEENDRENLLLTVFNHCRDVSCRFIRRRASRVLAKRCNYFSESKISHFTAASKRFFKTFT